MSYRPNEKEWLRTRNKYFEPNQPKAPYYKTRQLDYEAGADALLEALRNEGVFTYGNHTPDIELDDAPEESGYWCFIPEED